MVLDDAESHQLMFLNVSAIIVQPNPSLLVSFATGSPTKSHRAFFTWRRVCFFFGIVKVSFHRLIFD